MVRCCFLKGRVIIGLLCYIILGGVIRVVFVEIRRGDFSNGLTESLF